MLPITIPGMECWDEKNEEFVTINETNIVIEHSLASISEWEAKYKKPFLDSDKTNSEIIDYIRIMTIFPEEKPDISVYMQMTREQIHAISAYMKDSHTATWFREEQKTHKKEVVTSEIVYYWMFSNQIPIECQYWNFNRLITLIRVFDSKNKPPKKMSQSELCRRNSALNAVRRKKLNSRG